MLANLKKVTRRSWFAGAWLCLWTLPLFSAGELILKDGKNLSYEGEPAIAKNMLELTASDGEHLLLSKGLIDWQATWYRNPDLVAAIKPDVAQELARKNKARVPRKPVVMTNETLNSHRQKQNSVRSDSGHVTNTSAAFESRVPRSAEPSAPMTITHGDQINIAEHVDVSRIVVLDFYADWCGPCRRFTPQLLAFAARYPEHLVVKKVDIVKWGSPVATQFGVRSIPHVRVYDAGGDFLKKGGGSAMLQFLKFKARREKW